MTAETPRILLVDDDVDFVEMNRHVLEAGGYRVEAAYDAEEALGKMAALSPHLVITDLIMKTLDAGFSFARRVKEDPRFRAVRVIIVTSVTSAMGMDFRPRTPPKTLRRCMPMPTSTSRSPRRRSWQRCRNSSPNPGRRRPLSRQCRQTKMVWTAGAGSSKNNLPGRRSGLKGRGV